MIQQHSAPRGRAIDGFMFFTFLLGITQKRCQPAAAWYFSSFAGSFFALQGEKRTYKG
jgi:hypothetical protein